MLPRCLRSILGLLLALSLASPAFGTDAEPEPGTQGYLFIEIDGLSEPRLRQAIDEGAMPFVGSLVASGSHVLSGWRTIGSSTTPTSQAGILHGRSDDVPGYRWWDREHRRLVVASDQADARAIESAASSGQDLLAADGTSITNVVSGGASRSVLTLSRVGSLGLGVDVVTLLADPASAVALLIGLADAATTEVRHRLKGEAPVIQPQVSRKIPLTIVGPALEALLIDISRVAVIREIALGTPVVYASFVSYDEVAHYAGPEHVVADDILARIDLAIGAVAGATATAPRPYRLVILSDHGQTPGVPFEQRYGSTLEDVMRDALHDGADPIVASSGSLAHVYLSSPERLDHEHIDRRSPGLVQELADHPGIGVVVTRTAQGHLIAYGPRGQHDLWSQEVTGDDPLEVYGPDAADSLRHIGGSDDAGDLIVLSAYDSAAGEVASFERQFSSHGGLGGAQTRPVLVYPAVLEAGAPIELVGAEAVNAKLRAWMATDGQAR